MIAGQKYAFRTTHKEGGGGDYLRLGVQVHDTGLTRPKDELAFNTVREVQALEVSLSNKPRITLSLPSPSPSLPYPFSFSFPLTPSICRFVHVYLFYFFFLSFFFHHWPGWYFLFIPVSPF